MPKSQAYCSLSNQTQLRGNVGVWKEPFSYLLNPSTPQAISHYCLSQSAIKKIYWLCRKALGIVNWSLLLLFNSSNNSRLQTCILHQLFSLEFLSISVTALGLGKQDAESQIDASRFIFLLVTSHHHLKYRRKHCENYREMYLKK